MPQADGLYQVTYKGICAGYEVRDGSVVACAPILRRKFDFWRTIAVRVVPTMPILLNTGPSRRGAHRLMLALTCPAKYAFSKVLNHEAANISKKEALVKGTLVHVALAHHYARLGCVQNDADPETYYPPHVAIDMVASEQGPVGLHLAAGVHDIYNKYASFYAIERQRVVAVEVPVEVAVACPDGVERLFTQRWDLVLQDDGGKIWVIDHKTAAKPDSNTVARYALSVQFTGMLWLAQRRYGAQLGGIKLNIVGTREPYAFSRPVLPAAPDAVRRFPQTLQQAEQIIDETEHLADPWDARRVYNEQVCVGPYGACECIELCRFGRGHITMDGRTL